MRGATLGVSPPRHSAGFRGGYAWAFPRAQYSTERRRMAVWIHANACLPSTLVLAYQKHYTAWEKSRGMAALNFKNRQSAIVNCKYMRIVACILVREAV